MIVPRPYQRRCADAFYSYYDKHDGHGLIVVPTAAGKSIIIGMLATEIYQKWNSQRILILSHVRELIKQNHEKIMLCDPRAPAGIYSAALKMRQAHHPIVVATVQSVYKKAATLGHRDLCFIDEAHLLQDGGVGMYHELISGLLAINPLMKICGFTATDYRLDSGALTDGENSLFTDIIIEIPLLELLQDGYLTPPISKASTAQADMSGVKLTAGEFNTKQMAARFNTQEFLNAALDSDMPYFTDRRSIALFCPTIENAEHVSFGMRQRGIECDVIDGEMSGAERENKLDRFRSGRLRALASVGVMTTGTDIPNMDCIVLLRATQSPGLYQQIVGRGFRVMYADGYNLKSRDGRLSAIRTGLKPNFLILDHGGNIMRHGAITHVEKPRKREKGEKRSEKPKVRICKFCRSCWPLEATICGTCNSELIAERDSTASLDIEASDADIMGTPFSRGEVAQWFDVEGISYTRHVKHDRPDSLRITYYSGILQFNEWVYFPSACANIFWPQRSTWTMPKSVDEALAAQHTLKTPARVMIHKKKQYYEVLRHEFNDSLRESRTDLSA